MYFNISNVTTALDKDCQYLFKRKMSMMVIWYKEVCLFNKKETLKLIIKDDNKLKI